MGKEYYVCPNDSDVVLFEDDGTDLDSFQLMTPDAVDPPKECPKCGTSFYQWECKKKNVDS